MNVETKDIIFLAPPIALLVYTIYRWLIAKKDMPDNGPDKYIGLGN